MSQFLIKTSRVLDTGWVNLKKIVRKTNQRKSEWYQAAANIQLFMKYLPHEFENARAHCFWSLMERHQLQNFT